MKGLTVKAKDEIAVVSENSCCNTALLSALIHSAGTISFSSDGFGVYVSAEHLKTVKLVKQLVGLLYGKRGKLNGNTLELRGDYVIGMLFDLGILTYYGEDIGAMAGINGFVVSDECCVKSYLRGLFLGSGSVSVAKKYHLEMVFSTVDMVEDVCDMLEAYGIIARRTQRKDKHIVYIKSCEGISDFFALIGANNAVLELNNTAAMRYVKMYTNRRINCDMANADKVVKTSLVQIEAIKKIMDTLTDEKLIITARARIDNPDLSYEGLAEILGVSKGSVKYRLNKLVDLATRS